ncbi:hypothetical protein B0T24DRAFT_625704 [Lasiosphaeria ovina]|uniref:Conidiation-specific protein 13 n=1 Tax=Lasiosphaeria ovina TaxID=92902 RepID=A0AAE0KCG4_9PEZI|nr:hypothetical protein B0T24DRAFT_625704 [Lasiosphaeria ovina]
MAVFKTLLIALAAAANAPAAVVAFQPDPRATNTGLAKRADAYPFCNPATNPNCIAGGKYLVPILEFSSENGPGDLAYQQYLPASPWTFSKWTNGLMPERCYYWGVTADKWKATDFLVYNVTYTDCATPFVVCRHQKSTKSIGQLASQIGKLPVRMRQASSIYIVYGDLNTDNPNYGGYMATLAGDGVVVGRSVAYFSTSLVHETGHAVDSTLASPGGGKPFSGTAAWAAAVKADGYAVSAYGAGSYVEDFAEAGRAVLLDTVVPGGLAAFTGGKNANLTQIAAQLKAFKAVAGTFYTPGGKCDLAKKFPFPTKLVKRV